MFVRTLELGSLDSAGRESFIAMTRDVRPLDPLSPSLLLCDWSQAVNETYAVLIKSI